MIVAASRPGADLVVSSSVILLGALIIVGLATGIYLGMSPQDQKDARDIAATVGIWLLLILGVVLICFGIRGLVNA